MSKIQIPYLCGGTFLCQILRARLPLATPDDHTKQVKEPLSEPNTFGELINIFNLGSFFGGSTLSPYTSTYKSCAKSLASFVGYSDIDRRRAFDEDIKKENSTALKMTAEFVEKYIDPNKYEQLARCLIGLIGEDDSIDDEELFYIADADCPIKKKDIPDMESFCIERVILGVWHYIAMNRYDDNENGAATYSAWYPARDDYRGTVGSSITKHLDVQRVDSGTFEDQKTVPDDDTADAETVDAETVSDEEMSRGDITNQTLYSGKFQNFGNGVIQAEKIENLTIKFDD